LALLLLEVEMGFFCTLARAFTLWVTENAIDLVSVAVIPGTARVVARTLGPQPTRWATANRWAMKTVDGGITGGVVPPQAGAKYAVPKGLPKAGEKALAIENEPHLADGFSGEITAGYGKGTKTLLADEKVAVKIGTKMLIGRMNYHYHEAEKAGPHYDIVVEGVPSGTEQFEVHIPRGAYKGRYAFVATKKGTLIVPMADEGLALAKPDYTLKPVEFLDQLKDAANDWVFEQKVDGGLVNVKIKDARGVFRSHRPTGQTYYDRIPQLESLDNHSRVYLLRRWMPAPRLDNTVLKGELVHPDGHGRMGGVLNALPEKAQEIQRLRGPAEFYGWDIVRYRGRDVSGWPYAQRRALLEDVVKEIRLYNRHWHVVRAMRPGDDPREFYQSIVRRPLPWGEGVVIKRASDPAGCGWFKVKDVDFVDYPVVDFVQGDGKYAGSLGAIVVESPVTGARGEVGSFHVSDAQREWIWQHRDELAGTVAKVRVQEVTARGVPRAGVFMGFHEGKGSEAGLRMYAETLAGGDPDEARHTMYALKSAAGWRR
jgi:hypothetical protein